METKARHRDKASLFRTLAGRLHGEYVLLQLEYIHAADMPNGGEHCMTFITHYRYSAVVVRILQTK